MTRSGPFTPFGQPVSAQFINMESPGRSGVASHCRTHFPSHGSFMGRYYYHPMSAVSSASRCSCILASSSICRTSARWISAGSVGFSGGAT